VFADIMGSAARRSLSARHELFVVYYSDPGSDTFGCARRSYMRIYRCTPRSADTNAWRLLSYDGVRAAVKERLERNSVGLEHRIAALAEVLEGGKDTRKEYDVAGTLVRTTVSDRPASDRLKAIDILNKLDGSYDQATTVNNASTDRTAAMIADNLPLLHQPPGRTGKEGSA
jgi:hypothetical protein